MAILRRSLKQTCIPHNPHCPLCGLLKHSVLEHPKGTCSKCLQTVGLGQSVQHCRGQSRLGVPTMQGCPCPKKRLDLHGGEDDACKITEGLCATPESKSCMYIYMLRTPEAARECCTRVLHERRIEDFNTRSGYRLAEFSVAWKAPSTRAEPAPAAPDECPIADNLYQVAMGFPDCHYLLRSAPRPGDRDSN